MSFMNGQLGVFNFQIIYNLKQIKQLLMSDYSGFKKCVPLKSCEFKSFNEICVKRNAIDFLF